MEAPYPAAEQQQLHGKGAIDQCIWADRVGPHQRPAQQGGRQTPSGPEEARLLTIADPKATPQLGPSLTAISPTRLKSRESCS